MRTTTCIALASALALAASVAHARPSGDAAAAPRRAKQTTLKVFVLAGQSNAVGMAETNMTNRTTGKPANGTLIYQVNDPRTAAQFAPLWDKSTNNWTVLEDVSMWYNEVGQLGKDGTMVNGSKIPGVNGVDACFGKLHPGYGAGCGANQMGHFGPELGFGFGMAAALQQGEKFLIMKNAWGGKTLSGDFRPPSSAATFDPYCTDASRCGHAGHYYNVTMANVAKMMAPGAIGKMFPDLADMTPEIAGFGWWQGWNDGCDLNSTAAYEKNLVNLIQDVRKAWNTPSLPVSVATAGFLSLEESALEEASRSPKYPTAWVDGLPKQKMGQNCINDRGCRRLDVVLSQIAGTNSTRHSELGGHAVTADQRGYWRPPQFSPAPGQGYHYFHNAETYFLTGLAMAKGVVQAMAE